MLQQTRAETVIPYYRRFLEHYPSVSALARAEMEDVLKDWEGLGYYSRARNLKKAAEMIVHDLNGVFPRDVKGLLVLPGIGRYTAGAIASMAYGLPEPAIDGNQVRVLSRLFCVTEPVRGAAVQKRLYDHACALMDRERAGDFNQALMGMGALVCLPGKARCEDCPVCGLCLSRQSGIQNELPHLPEKADKRREYRAVALVFQDNKVLVRRRPEGGLLGGLWEFPHFLDARDDSAVREALREMGISAKNHQPGLCARHVFTHLVWEMTGHIYEAIPGAPDTCVFVNARELSALPMPTAHKIYREEALKRL